MLIRPSLSPPEIQSSLSISFAFAGSGTNSSGALVFGAEENPPIQAKVSRCASRKSGEGAILAIRLRGIFRLDGWNEVLQQIVFKIRKSWRCGIDISLGAVIR